MFWLVTALASAGVCGFSVLTALHRIGGSADGSTLAVGAALEDSAATGVAGNQVVLRMRCTKK